MMAINIDCLEASVDPVGPAPRLPRLAPWHETLRDDRTMSYPHRPTHVPSSKTMADPPEITENLASAS